MQIKRKANRELRFVGMIDEMATVVAIKQDKENIDFTLKCSFVDELGIDQSGL